MAKAKLSLLLLKTMIVMLKVTMMILMIVVVTLKIRVSARPCPLVIKTQDRPQNAEAIKNS